jgi:hypothetical protein
MTGPRSVFPQKWGRDLTWLNNSATVDELRGAGPVHDRSGGRRCVLAGVDQAPGDGSVDGCLQNRHRRRPRMGLAAELQVNTLSGGGGRLDHVRPTWVEPVNDTMSTCGWCVTAPIRNPSRYRWTH